MSIVIDVIRISLVNAVYMGVSNKCATSHKQNISPSAYKNAI